MLKKKENILIILGIIFISFNLRAPITTVGSVVKMIAEEYHLTSGAAGFITTLPLLAFAVVSPFVSRISGKLGYGKTMLLGLVLILTGEFVRSYTNVWGLFAGTAVLGVGIAIGNVLIPGIIKLKFSEAVGRMTSIYTSSMCVFAAVGAGVSVPLSSGLGLGWKNTLAVWLILALVTLCIWWPQVKGSASAARGAVSVAAPAEAAPPIWKSKTAWFVTAFMGTQSLLFYSMVAWLPTIVVSKGMTQTFAGNMALAYQLVALPATLAVPLLCDKFKDQRCLASAGCLVYLIGMALLLIGSSPYLLIGAVSLLALGAGGSISLSIAFISLRSPNAARASALSGMSQSAGYLLAAIGPALMGYIYDLSLSWFIPMILFMVFLVLLFLFGLQAGNDVTVAAERKI